MTTRKKPSLPRVPAIRQTEKVHEKKSKDRKVKHRKRELEQWGPPLQFRSGFTVTLFR